MKRKLLNILGVILATGSVQAQSFNTIVGVSPRYRVETTQSSSGFDEAEAHKKTEEASPEGDTSSVIFVGCAM